MMFIIGIIMNFTVIIAIIYMFLQNVYLKYFIIYDSVLCGTFVSAYRVINKGVFRDLKWKICPKKMRKNVVNLTNCTNTLLLSSILSELDDEPCNLADCFKQKNLKVKYRQDILSVLCGLTLRYSSDLYECKTLSEDLKFYFNENKFFGRLDVKGVHGLENSELYLVYDPSFCVHEFEPMTFKEIREDCGLGSGFFMNSFFTAENARKIYSFSGIDGGRSGSFLFTTSNQRFTIKIITIKEFNNLIKIVKRYCAYKKENSGSRLVNIYAAVKILPWNINVILMENVIRNRNNKIIFDLKGSITDRKVELENLNLYGKVLKDLNFIELGQKLPSNPQLIENLKKDFKFLSDLKLIDYSVLIAIDPQNSNNYSLGIIDFLQNYSFKKKLEKNFKLLIRSQAPSVATPEDYCSRISNFIEQVFTDPLN